MTEGLTEPQKGQLTYNSYLKVGELINLQVLQSDPPQHDEMLFIIIHQAYELWFKQMLHEVTAMKSFLLKDDLLAVFKCCRRVIRIQDLLVKQVDILETMTPNDFNRFSRVIEPCLRLSVRPVSCLRVSVGLKACYLRYHSNDPAATKALRRLSLNPRCMIAFAKCLDRLGLDIPQEVLTGMSRPPTRNRNTSRKSLVPFIATQKPITMCICSSNC